MKLYRFSPIKSYEELLKAIEHIHFESYKLCNQTFGKHLANIGNMGIFCHYDDEYEYLTDLRKKLTKPSNNPNQKYFELNEPIKVPATADIPEVIYTHLYIRRPDPYRFHVGDIDFCLETEDYLKLKQRFIYGEKFKGARLFDRPDLDMIELYDQDSDVLAYVSAIQEAERVRVKQSDITKL